MNRQRWRYAVTNGTVLHLSGLSKQTMRRIERDYPVTNVLWHSDSHFASYNVDEEDEFRIPDRDELRSIEADYPWITDNWGPTQLVQFQAAYCSEHMPQIYESISVSFDVRGETRR